MKINLLAIGNRMPAWVNAGFQEYAKRLPSDYQLRLIEIPALKRSKSTDTKRVLKQEGEMLLKAMPSGSLLIALNVIGEQWDTPRLAQRLKQWHDSASDISLMVGGPEGLDRLCLKEASIHWSLSALTLPHPFVRVIVAEQCYRAWSIITNHPYHRQ